MADMAMLKNGVLPVAGFTWRINQLTVTDTIGVIKKYRWDRP
jgi:hypothetical protein